jgi:hypothetical protein
MSPKNKNVPNPLVGVPIADVGDKVQSFIDNDGVKQMDVSQQPDGTFTITPKK